MMKVDLLYLSQSVVKETCEFHTPRLAGESTLRISTRNGWRDLDSRFDPGREAEELARKIPLHSSSFLLCGTGSGYIAEELVKRSHTKSLLIITPVRTAAERTIDRLRNLPESTAECLVIYYDDPVQLAETLRDLDKNWTDRRLLYHQREINAFPALFHPFIARWEVAKRSCSSRNKTRIERILFPVSGGLFEKELIREFDARGIRVSTVPSLSNRKKTYEEIFALLKEHGPDLVFSINNLGSDTNGIFPLVCNQLNIRWASWFLDDPRFILSPMESEIRSDGRLAFLWDQRGIESWRSLRPGKTVALPLATDPITFFPGDGNPDLQGRVVFVGSPMFESTHGYFAALLQDEKALEIADVFQETILEKRITPSPDSIKNVLEEKGWLPDFQGERLRRLPSFCVQVANREYRRRALTALADLKPVIYGNGWSDLLPGTVEVRPHADYDRELPVIYRSDAIHISLTNLQMSHYPNQRLFDVGACRRMVLSESLPGMRELFDREIEPLLFHNFSYLREQCIHFIENPGERREYGKYLYSHVLARHTISHRVDRILESVKAMDSSDDNKR